jgi:hypothetical protein
MVNSGLVHVLTQLIHNKGDIRMSNSVILQGVGQLIIWRKTMHGVKVVFFFWASSNVYNFF